MSEVPLYDEASERAVGGACHREGGHRYDPLQGYLAHKKPRPPRTLQYDYAWGRKAVLEGWAVSYEVEGERAVGGACHREGGHSKPSWERFELQKNTVKSA